jgi:hypothetical protein
MFWRARLRNAVSSLLTTAERSPRHFAECVANQHSAGVLIISQEYPIGGAAEEILMAWEASEAEEWIDTIQALPL